MAENKNRVSTTNLIDIIIDFCELFSGITFYPYQEQFARRIIRSVLTNDGSELSALFARQCIPEGELIHTREGKIIKIEDHPKSWVTNESAEILEIKVKGGYTLKCTANHPVMTDKGWINAGLLEEKDKVVTLSEWDKFGKGISKAKLLKFFDSIKDILSESTFDDTFLNIANSMSEKQIKDLLNYLCDSKLFTLSDNLSYARLNVKNYTLSRLFQSILSKVNVSSYVNPHNRLSVDRGALNNYLNGYSICNTNTFKGEDGEILKYCDVISINKLDGLHKVYDVEYPDKGWFICNGVKVHNSGKSETVSVVVGGLMIILPRLANMPMFLEDPRLNMFKNGLMAGIFAPSQRQAQTTYGKIRGKIMNERGQEILNDPDFRLDYTTSNGTTIALNNGSFVTAISASEGSNIEGESFQIIILEESQDISDFKVTKCLTGDTDVLLSNGEYKRIDQIVRDEKDELVCFDKDMQYLTSRVPYEFYDNGVQPVYKILLDGGQSIKATLNHKFYTFDTEKKCKFRTVKEIIDTMENDNPLRVGVVDKFYKKQELLNEDNEHRERSKYYPDSMRFVHVKSIEYVGEEATYCVNMDEDENGIHNIILGSVISGQSIHPMGAAYNATVVKIGTASTRKGNFFKVIERNKKDFEDGKLRIRNHFEYDYTVVSKYNSKYAKYIEQEKNRLGVKSDEFRLSYGLEWIFQRGMFTDIDDFEARNINLDYDIVPYDKSATHVVGIDVGGSSDSTVITVCEVDWNMPVVMESRLDEESGEEISYQCYNTYLKSWCEIKDTPNFEEQYPIIISYLNNFRVARLLIDATRERALADRLSANLTCEVVPYVFGVKSKSDLYKHFDKEILSGRAQIPGGKNTQDSPEFKKYMKEIGEMEKSWRGAHMVVSHPPTKDGRDDFIDSHALAVYGCIDEGNVNTNETHDRDTMFGKSKNLRNTVNGGRNRITAQRRR